MVEPAQDFDEFFGSLIAHGVEFLIVGADALAYHGAPRGSSGYSLEVGNPYGEPKRFILDLGKSALPSGWQPP